MGDLERAAELLGPLEGRIMRLVWQRRLSDPFVVRDVHALMPELAYTTVMTTVHRLADKGILELSAPAGQRAYSYRAAASPGEFLRQASLDEVDTVIERFGDAALAAFAARLEGLSPAQRDRLRRLTER